MGTITSSIGLVSGIDTGSIIQQLVDLERRPIQTLQGRIAQTSEVQIALTSFSTRLNALKNSGTDLRKPSTFQAVAATSSDPAALGVTAKVGAPQGRYGVTVRSLVQSQQAVSSGFATKDAELEPGTLSIEVGGGSLERKTSLALLNGGDGVAAGKFRLTDAAGRDTVIDTSGLQTLEEVVDAINFNPDADVSAAIEDNRLVLRDESGGAGSLVVRDLAGGTSADSLGISTDTRDATTSTKITGGNLAALTTDTLLADLGVTFEAGNDIRVTDRRNDRYNIDLSAAVTVGDLITTFNDATGGEVTLSFNADRSGFNITNNAGGNKDMVVESRNGANVAEALGIAIDVDDDDGFGQEIASLPGSIRVDELRGGQGLDGSSFTITDRAGNERTIFTSTRYLEDIIDDVNESGLGVVARINDAGNGIALEDVSGGTGDLVIESDGGGSSAEQLGIAGTFGLATEVVDGGSLQRAFINRETRLDSYDLGREVGQGTFSITDSAGQTAEIDLSVGSYDTLGDVIDSINALTLDVTARVNDAGDGLVIEDNAGGIGSLIIEDVTGGSAEALRIEGAFDDGVADGSFEAKIEVEAGDTLEDVRDKINQLGYGVRAELLNDGTPGEPWRLSLSARNSGTAGAFTFDAGTTGLATRTIAEARDAVVFIGGDQGLAPLTVTSTTNTIENALPGVTLDLNATTVGRTIEVSVTADQEGVLEDVKTMIEAFNAFRDTIDDNSGYNEETDRRGVLLGEPSVSRAESVVYGLVNRIYGEGSSTYRILADIGIQIGEGAKLEFDEERFAAALADDPDAVMEMFTATDSDGEGIGFGHQLQNVIGDLTDPVDGVVTRASQVLDERTAAYEEQIERIEEQVLVKEARLQKQFLDMELALSQLQFQQQQLGSIPTFQKRNDSDN